MKIYIFFNRKNIYSEFALNGVDSNFLQNELAHIEEYKDVIPIFITEMVRKELMQAQNQYNSY